jgi:hypothetical protein
MNQLVSTDSTVQTDNCVGPDPDAGRHRGHRHASRSAARIRDALELGRRLVSSMPHERPSIALAYRG